MTELEDLKPKSFWKKPEGVTGIIFAILLAIGGGFLLTWLLPLIQTTLHAILLLVGIGALTYVLLDSRFRNLIFFMYKSIMRFITKLFVEIDPIGILKTRKAGRLKESNVTLENLYTRMEVLYRVLSKMYENAEVLFEDVKDEVEVRKREREAIRAGHSAFKSAMKIISGDKDKKVMFDAAME